MKKLFSIMAFALITGLLLWSGDALASWGQAYEEVTYSFQRTRRMIFIIGGFVFFFVILPGILTPIIISAVRNSKRKDE